MSVLDLSIVSFVLELIEFFLFYDTTFKAVLYKLYNYYKKSVILFFLAHLNYIWLLYISVAYDNLSWPLIFAISLKTFDIVTKLDLIKKIFVKPDLKYISEISVILDVKIPLLFYFVSILTYPYLIYLSF